MLQKESIGIGIPRQIMCVTEIDCEIVRRNLNADLATEITDIENEEVYAFFKKFLNRPNLSAEINAIRTALKSIFGRKYEGFLNRKDLGYWRIVARINAERDSVRRKFGAHLESHYAVYRQDGQTLLRAKGLSFNQACSYFEEAIKKS